jgi:hypothetical protein
MPFVAYICILNRKKMTYHKILGQVEIIEVNSTDTIVMNAAGEKREILNIMVPVLLSDKPFEVAKKSITSKYINRMIDNHSASKRNAEYFEHKF